MAFHHLDPDNSEVHFAKNTLALLESESKPVVSANAYLGAREIIKVWNFALISSLPGESPMLPM